MSIIEKHSGKEHTNILLSASPNDYVSKLAAKLGWIGVGTDFVNGNFVHYFGENKVSYILNEYPSDKYKYNFAISDSSSDEALLNLFSTKVLIQ